MTWQVFVEDRERYADEEGRRLHSTHDTLAAARSTAEGLVERSLQELRSPGQSAGLLFSLWSLFGQDAYLIPDDPTGRFSGQDYARARAGAFCSQPASNDP